MSEPCYGEISDELLETILVGKMNKFFEIVAKADRHEPITLSMYNKAVVLDSQITRIKQELKERNAPTDEWELGNRGNG